MTDRALIERLRAKAWQSSSRRNSAGGLSDHQNHVCWQAADRLEALTGGEAETQLVQELHELGGQVDDLAMLVCKLVRHVPDGKQIKVQAVDYLNRHDLGGSPLRAASLPPQDAGGRV
jgi:hypothetical protein